jgi:hypothetical protein
VVVVEQSCGGIFQRHIPPFLLNKLRSGFHRAELTATRFYSMQIYFGVAGIIPSFAGLLLCACRKSPHYRGRSRSWPCRSLSAFITLPTG